MKIPIISRIIATTVKPADIGRLLKKISKKPFSKITGPIRALTCCTDDYQKIFESIASDEFNISGFQNKNLRVKLANKTTAHISIIIKRLRNHGLVKKIGHSYYYLTNIGRHVIATGLQLKELFLIPKLSKITTD